MCSTKRRVGVALTIFVAFLLLTSACGTDEPDSVSNDRSLPSGSSTSNPPRDRGNAVIAKQEQTTTNRVPRPPDSPSTDREAEAEDWQLSLEAFLWRDFIPGPDDVPEGSPLMAVVWVTAANSETFPEPLHADRMWIMNGSKTWETEFSNEPRPQDPDRKHQLEKFANSGPKWGPGIPVNVRVRVVDSRTNKIYFVEALNQSIQPIE